MMSDTLLVEQRGALGLLTLNRPQALNALNFDMVQAINEQLNRWKQDVSVQAVVLQAAPSKAFCAGGDIRALYETGKACDPRQMDFFRHEYQMNLAIHTFNKPFIALMDGITMGGGVGVAMHGSFPIATEKFSFAMPETGIGFFPDVGASYLLTRCPDQMGIYLGLTGNRLNASEALALGLVKQIIPSEQLPSLVFALEHLDYGAHPFAAVEQCLREYAVGEDLLQEKGDLFHPANYTALNQAFSAPSVEDILVQLNQLDYSWAQDIAAQLQQKSPLSLKVTLEQLHLARGLSLEACLQMDYCLVSHFAQDKDFYEGVRALIVDKDKNPRWMPPRLQEVSEAKVNSYFIALQQPLVF